MITKTKLLSFNFETLEEYFARLVATSNAIQRAQMIEDLSRNQARKLGEFAAKLKDTEKANQILTELNLLK